MLDQPVAPEAKPTDATSGQGGVGRAGGLGIAFWCCVAWLGVLGFVTVFAGLLPFQDPALGNFLNPGPDAGFSLGHLLGTDQDARDILSRLVHGAQVSLVIGLGATAIGILLGGSLGMLAAYLRGRVDAVLSLVMYSGLAFPAIVAVMAILAFWGQGEFQVMIVIGLFSVPLIYRLVRAATLSYATREYVTVARAQGATAARVLGREILPNVAPALAAYALFTLGGAIATEGALAFLGLSVLPPTSSWGTLISDAATDSGNLFLLFAPAAALFLTLVSLNYVGERVRRRFDPGASR